MSTSYRIAGRGARLTEKAIRQIATEEGWTVEIAAYNGSPVENLTVAGPFGWVHFHQTGKTAWNTFERFGLNDAGPVVEALEGRCYTVYSEHEDPLLS